MCAFCLLEGEQCESERVLTASKASVYLRSSGIISLEVSGIPPWTPSEDRCGTGCLERHPWYGQKLQNVGPAGGSMLVGGKLEHTHSHCMPASSVAQLCSSSKPILSGFYRVLFTWFLERLPSRIEKRGFLLPKSNWLLSFLSIPRCSH